MSIRWKNHRPIVEIYDPIIGRKRHVKARDHDIEPPPAGASHRTLERFAKELERRALTARDTARPGTGDEAIDSFTTRWASDYAAGRGDSTRAHNHERVQAYAKADEHAGRTLRQLGADRAAARTWATAHEGTVPALRAMFNDALADKLCDENPFAKLGLEASKGREDITVLTVDELQVLVDVAQAVHGPLFGPTVSAMIRWGAYTCMRPGEIYAARHSLLDGDVYHLRKQFNSKLGRETAPKHDGVGAIYVPEQARAAVLEQARQLGDDLMFRTKRGHQFRQESLHRAWTPVRERFLERLPVGHHLHERLALDPEDRFDFYELRHFGASHMLNELGIEPWVIAKQLRQSDDGALVVKLYGHPTRKTAIDKMRRAFEARDVAPLRAAGDAREAM